MFSYLLVSKLEYLRSALGQMPEPSLHGSDAQHPRNWILLFWQMKKAPPFGQERPRVSIGSDISMMVLVSGGTDD